MLPFVHYKCKGGCGVSKSAEGKWSQLKSRTRQAWRIHEKKRRHFGTAPRPTTKTLGRMPRVEGRFQPSGGFDSKCAGGAGSDKTECLMKLRPLCFLLLPPSWPSQSFSV